MVAATTYQFHTIVDGISVPLTKIQLPAPGRNILGDNEEDKFIVLSTVEAVEISEDSVAGTNIGLNKVGAVQFTDSSIFFNDLDDQKKAQVAGVIFDYKLTLGAGLLDLEEVYTELKLALETLTSADFSTDEEKVIDMIKSELAAKDVYTVLKTPGKKILLLNKPFTKNRYDNKAYFNVQMLQARWAAAVVADITMTLQVNAQLILVRNVSKAEIEQAFKDLQDD